MAYGGNDRVRRAAIPARAQGTGTVTASRAQITGVTISLRPPRAAARLVVACTLLTGTACLDFGRPIDWRDESAEQIALPAAADAASREQALHAVLAAMPEASAERGPRAPLPVIQMPPAPDLALGDSAAPVDPRRCDGSLQHRATPRGEVAVWWSAGERNRVHLFAAWRHAGETVWRGPIPVDTLDQGSSDARDAASGGAVGCVRPAAGLWVDEANGYVHVSYALVGPEGPGIFYAHQMDPRAAFEPPVPIVYGERLGAARVASDGDFVAVAYEDPNSGTRPRIALALSRTAGHLFERRLTVNAGLNPAADPFVLLQGAALVVGWSESPPAGGDVTFLRRRATFR